VNHWVDALAKGIIDMKFCSEVEDDLWTLRLIGVYAKNCEEWITVDLACIVSDLTTVTLYDTLGAESTEIIIN